MNRPTFVVCALAVINVLFVVSANGEEMTWGELKAKNVAPLTKEELEALLPGTTYEMVDGKWRIYWKHETDGHLAGEMRMMNTQTMHRNRTGTWSVSPNGAYCVDAKGQTDDDATKWCRHVWKIDDKYYGANRNSKNDSMRVVSFTLKK